MTTFPTPAPISAVVTVPAARVRFVATDRTDTTVEIRPADAAKTRDAKAAEQTTVDHADGVLRIAAPAKNQYFGPSGVIDVTVGLPTGSRVELTAADVEFLSVGRLGAVAVETEHGSIDVDEATTAHLTTRAGDVSVGRLTGDAELRTSKGDLRIVEAGPGTVVLRTEAGDIEIATAASAALDAGTAHGRISNSLKNSGGAAELTIHATTAVGDITARGL
ncbi:DUF4097 and DUF4098 domain-containing protein YvlB [Amycolatopsis lexingtonensis]|uniref:DUF4097 and DUF4098 domain-containing protein YvlB n=1 Tax=Amycolatopsis lexingtonensis TaxID=218822 RepID=A0ABR9I838_9PSEU|nr:DUF4097 family beta strand repeat-containing protein [Amycolatopsis lexingtonensis]MBE1499366.1 DUF4097 and DUF4098 domain-containing protein YvlB [Amycolatopsis lexingtonensis]